MIYTGSALVDIVHFFDSLLLFLGNHIYVAVITEHSITVQTVCISSLSQLGGREWKVERRVESGGWRVERSRGVGQARVHSDIW